jgi:hypothetical protein
MSDDVGRRKFLSGAGIANINDLKLDEPLTVSYPDNEAPGVPLKVGKPVAQGARTGHCRLCDNLPA